jgi:hypothetical protein
MGTFPYRNLRLAGPAATSCEITQKTGRLRDLFARDPARFEKLSVEAAGLVSRLFEKYCRRKTPCKYCALSHAMMQVEKPARRHVRRQGNQSHRTARRLAYRIAQTARRTNCCWMEKTSSSRRACSARQNCRCSPIAYAPVTWRGFDGREITDIVNIGIGGSYLGPKMTCQALRAFATSAAENAFRLQCRWARSRCTAAADRSGHDSVHHFVKNLQHVGDDDERTSARAWFLKSCRRGRIAETLRCSLHPIWNLVTAIRYRSRKTCFRSGTGSVAAIRYGRRSACRLRCRSV